MVQVGVGELKTGQLGGWELALGEGSAVSCLLYCDGILVCCGEGSSVPCGTCSFISLWNTLEAGNSWHVFLEMGQLSEIDLWVFVWGSLFPPKFTQVPILF